MSACQLVVEDAPYLQSPMSTNVSWWRHTFYAIEEAVCTPNLLHKGLSDIALAKRSEYCRWACVPDGEWPNDPNQRQVIISDFDLETEYGDRRQEIVFIGANMDEKAICDQLDTALLTEEEMVKYNDRYSTVSFLLIVVQRDGLQN